MAKKMHKCVEVDKNYAASAPKSFQAVVEVDATPEQVFEVFEDAEAWPAWAIPIKKVIWTAPKPYGLGTTRTVEMIGITGDETFIAWDYPKHMAFCFTHVSETMIESFAEDYVVTPLENGKTRVQWTMGMTPQSYGKVTMALFGPFMGMGLKFLLGRFQKYTNKRFA